MTPEKGSRWASPLQEVIVRVSNEDEPDGEPWVCVMVEKPAALRGPHWMRVADWPLEWVEIEP